MDETPQSPPLGIPPFVHRSVLMWLGSGALFVLLAIVWPRLRDTFGLPSGGIWRFMPLALISVPFLVLFPIWHWRLRRFRRALFASRFRLCTVCAYDLSSLAPTGTCPECGRAYDAQRDVARWERTGAPYAEPRPKGFVPWSSAGGRDPSGS